MRFATLLFCLLLSACHRTDCDRIPISFNSFSEANKIIKSSHFKFEDKIITNTSSWIRGAEYYSCNNETGFFILITDNVNYIHQELPKQMWYEFKTASSYGHYYNSKIKHRFQCRIK